LDAVRDCLEGCQCFSRALPLRLMIYAFLIVAVMVALWFAAPTAS
jgi:hypothetical protein